MYVGAPWPYWTSSPAAIAQGFTEVALGTDFTCGLDLAGVAQCVGRNHWGQLGDGTIRDTSAFVPVATTNTFKAIVAGYVYTCALAAGGSTWCWGLLGGPPGSPPTLIGPGLQSQSISGDGMHLCGLATDVRAWCAGANGTGQLGIGRYFASSWTVNFVIGGHTFVRMQAGGSSSCGVQASGLTLCWGANSAGQLGNGEISPNPDDAAASPAPRPAPGKVLFK